MHVLKILSHSWVVAFDDIADGDEVLPSHSHCYIEVGVIGVAFVSGEGKGCAELQ